MKKSSKASISLQEQIDYSVAERTLSGIYGSMLSNIMPLEETSPADAAYTAETQQIEAHYLVEIKSVYNDWWMTKGEIFQFAKYAKLMSFANQRADKERVLLLFIMHNTNEVLIWDLEKIKANHTKVAMTKVKHAEFVEGSPSMEVPCLYLNLKDCVWRGSFKYTNDELDMLDLRDKLLSMGE